MPEERRSKNTAVYVTNLPSDTTHDEIVSTFSKCGLIEEDDHGDPKVKLYAREDGSFSGEALVVYFKEESVGLALNIMDERELRLGDSGTVMKVQKAEFGHKHEGGGKERTEMKRKVVDKKAASRRIGKMQKCVTFIYTKVACVGCKRCSHYFINFWLGRSVNGTMKMASVP